MAASAPLWTESVVVRSNPIDEILFEVRIEESDYRTKLQDAAAILGRGQDVKLRLKFRGREMAHTEIGFAVIQRAVADLAPIGRAFHEPKLIGRNLHVTLKPASSGGKAGLK